MQLLEDVAALTVLLEYHVIPGRSLEKDEFKDGQRYDTLLEDKKKVAEQVEFDYKKEISAKEGTENVYYILATGGPKVEITAFDLNAGCPSVVHVVDAVLLPDFKDALAVDLTDTLLAVADAYQEAGAELPVGAQVFTHVAAP